MRVYEWYRLAGVAGSNQDKSLQRIIIIKLLKVATTSLVYIVELIIVVHIDYVKLSDMIILTDLL